MRYGYFWMESVIGVLLIISPFVEGFYRVSLSAGWTNLVLGILLLIWSAVGYFWHASEIRDVASHEPHPAHP